MYDLIIPLEFGVIEKDRAGFDEKLFQILTPNNRMLKIILPDKGVS